MLCLIQSLSEVLGVFGLWLREKVKERSCVGGNEAMHLTRELGRKVLNAVNKKRAAARCTDLQFGEYLGCGALLVSVSQNCFRFIEKLQAV